MTPKDFASHARAAQQAIAAVATPPTPVEALRPIAHTAADLRTLAMCAAPQLGPANLTEMVDLTYHLNQARRSAEQLAERIAAAPAEQQQLAADYPLSAPAAMPATDELQQFQLFVELERTWPAPNYERSQLVGKQIAGTITPEEQQRLNLIHAYIVYRKDRICRQQPLTAPVAGSEVKP
jgi:hypothetical protein